jgi:hypothetical protein
MSLLPPAPCAPSWFVASLCAIAGILPTPRIAAAVAVPEAHWVQMTDGVRLATDAFLPKAQGPFPVILVRTPYDKQTAAGIARDGVRRGYAVVLQDTRGRSASEGENLPFRLDHVDGPATLEWVRRQPWCNGRVGTCGGSAAGIIQMLMLGRPVAPAARPRPTMAPARGRVAHARAAERFRPAHVCLPARGAGSKPGRLRVDVTRWPRGSRGHRTPTGCPCVHDKKP